MIEIELRLFATLTQYTPPAPEAFRVPRATTVEGLLSVLGIPREETKLIFINGKKQELDHGLSQGDRVGIFPPVGGG
ncbi:MAG: MoaD/ThiS family protein [Desulfobacterium sp.]|nr:MoaD/ThiS family protein [Desulfobacterium sp.]